MTRTTHNTYHTNVVCWLIWHGVRWRGEGEPPCYFDSPPFSYNFWTHWGGLTKPPCSQPKSIGLVWRLVATWRWVCIHHMNRVNSRNGATPWWQHHKYRHGCYYYYYGSLFQHSTRTKNAPKQDVNGKVSNTFCSGGYPISVGRGTAPPNASWPSTTQPLYSFLTMRTLQGNACVITWKPCVNILIAQTLPCCLSQPHRPDALPTIHRQGRMLFDSRCKYVPSSTVALHKHRGQRSDHNRQSWLHINCD